DDLVIGSPSAGRDRTELEDLVGCFVNTLALRLDVGGHDGEPGGPSFRRLLRRAREVGLDAYACPDLPFEQLVDAVGARRTLSRSPIFQVMLALQSIPLAPPRLPGLAAELLEIDAGTAKLDLTLALFPGSGGLVAQAEIHAELF